MVKLLLFVIRLNNNTLNANIDILRNLFSEVYGPAARPQGPTKHRFGRLGIRWGCYWGLTTHAVIDVPRCKSKYPHVKIGYNVYVSREEIGFSSLHQKP